MESNDLSIFKLMAQVASDKLSPEDYNKFAKFSQTLTISPSELGTGENIEEIEEIFDMKISPYKDINVTKDPKCNPPSGWKVWNRSALKSCIYYKDAIQIIMEHYKEKKGRPTYIHRNTKGKFYAFVPDEFQTALENIDGAFTTLGFTSIKIEYEYDSDL
jgi:hypothetical protein|tara:strand:- start:117 stop:596 length:480 start_codon:yes stop_codon:yes gene_type:complete